LTPDTPFGEFGADDQTYSFRCVASAREGEHGRDFQSVAFPTQKQFCRISSAITCLTRLMLSISWA